MINKVLNLENIRKNRMLVLSEKGTHLVSSYQVKGKTKDWAILPYQEFDINDVNLTRKFILGDVELYSTGQKALFKINGKDKWVIDILRFSGNPKLKVEENEGIIDITLTQARFPGTAILADFEAKIQLQDSTFRISLSFAWGGFQDEVNLKGWLEGNDVARSPIVAESLLCPLEQNSGLFLNGTQKAVFYPSWMFVIIANHSTSYNWGSGEIDFSTLIIALGAPGMPNILLDPPPRRTYFFLSRPTKFNFPCWSSQEKEWSFNGSEPPFSVLGIEAVETLSGQIRRALLASGPSNMELTFQPGLDLWRATGEPFGIELSGPKYAQAFNDDGNQVWSAMLATIKTGFHWIHTRVCSLLVGTPSRSGFLLWEHDGTDHLGHPLPMLEEHKPGLEYPLLATAARPGDVVVTPMPRINSDSMVHLTFDPLPAVLPFDDVLIELNTGDGYAKLTFPSEFCIGLLRPRDLLSLHYHFINLRLTSHGNDLPLLIPEGNATPYIIVTFPPQSIGEESFWEGENNSDPLPTISQGTLPIKSIISGPSQLAFKVKPSSYPFTIEALLDWRKENQQLDPSLTPAAKTYQGIHQIPQLRKPSAIETSIRAPFRLFLSPDQYGCWENTINAVDNSDGSRTELWHTRLVKDSSFQQDEYPVIRAIWATDKDNSVPSPGDEYYPFQLAPLSCSERVRLVENSVYKEPVKAKRLMLTTLGAWLDLDGQWNDQLERWLHKSTMGRDHYVKVIKRGYLMPFGHRAVYIRVTERKFEQWQLGIKGALLRTRAFIVVREPERSYFPLNAGANAVYPYLGRSFPFKSIRIATSVTPLLDQPIHSQIHPGIQSDAEDAFWICSSQNDVKFHLIGKDMAGKEIEFSAPMAFIRSYHDNNENDKNYIEGLTNTAIETLSQTRGKIEFESQSIAYAPSASPSSGDTTFETDNITFSAVQNKFNQDPDAKRLFNPIMAQSEIHIPALRQLANSTKSTVFRYYDTYLKKGFGPVNKGQIFACLPEGINVQFGGANSSDKVGGLLLPNIKVGGLSRSLGAVGADSGTGPITDQHLNDIATGFFDPVSYFASAMGAKLLGGITLNSLLGKVPFNSDLSNTPKWVSNYSGNSVTHGLHWSTTDFLSEPPLPFERFGSTKLELCAQIKTNGSNNAETMVKGVLQDFAINFGNVIRIKFKHLNFIIKPGEKPDMQVGVEAVSFAGDLAFLSKIEQFLGLDNFGDPPYLDISLEGIKAGYTLSLPSIAIGAFALQNISLGAGLTLPFTGQPMRARFNLAERHNLFLITVSLFAGGGFLAISVGPDAVESLEASLEFGGNFNLNLGVASGGVYIMAGIYLKLESDNSQLTGYVRAGGVLEVLGLISVSLEFYLGLTYGPGQVAWGEASMEVEVEVLFFSTSVTLTVRREFCSGSLDITFEEMMPEPAWKNYLAAFAEEE